MIDSKKRLRNKEFIKGDEAMQHIKPEETDILEKARAAGIDPTTILEVINSAVKNVSGFRSDGVCTSSDAERIKRVLVEKIQEILKKYQINGLEIGSYSDPYVMDGYTEVRIFLGSSGNLYEEYHDSRTQFIELNSSVLEELYSPKRIVGNLFARLTDMTEKNKAKIKEIEEAIDLQTSQ